MKVKKKIIDKQRGVALISFKQMNAKQGAKLGKRIKALQDEREEKRKRVKHLEDVKVLNSDKAGQPIGFIAPEEDIDLLLDGL